LISVSTSKLGGASRPLKAQSKSPTACHNTDERPGLEFKKAYKILTLSLPSSYLERFSKIDPHLKFSRSDDRGIARASIPLPDKKCFFEKINSSKRLFRKAKLSGTLL
jgi:hypothetical protein